MGLGRHWWWGWYCCCVSVHVVVSVAGVLHLRWCSSHLSSSYPIFPTCSPCLLFPIRRRGFLCSSRCRTQGSDYRRWHTCGTSAKRRIGEWDLTLPYFSCVFTPSVLGTSLHFLYGFDAPAGGSHRRNTGFFSLSLPAVPPAVLGLHLSLPSLLCVLANMRFPLLNRIFSPRMKSFEVATLGQKGCQVAN